MADVLSRLVEKLHAGGVEFTLTEHRAVFTSAEAAEVRGTPMHSGAKALIMQHPQGFVLAVLPADLALDSGAMRKLLWTKRLRFANKEELQELTGLTPGSIPPFGSLFGLETVCDERLAENDQINFNAGSNTRSIRMSYADYLRIEGPRLVKISA